MVETAYLVLVLDTSDCPLFSPVNGLWCLGRLVSKGGCLQRLCLSQVSSVSKVVPVLLLSDISQMVQAQLQYDNVAEVQNMGL